MATRELDRWLLNAGHYTEGYKPEAVNVRAVPETVRKTNASALTKNSVTAIICNHCGLKADRQGAQDNCDVYKCENQHITRLLVGIGLRTPWYTDRE